MTMILAIRGVVLVAVVIMTTAAIETKLEVITSAKMTLASKAKMVVEMGGNIGITCEGVW